MIPFSSYMLDTLSTKCNRREFFLSRRAQFREWITTREREERRGGRREVREKSLGESGNSDSRGLLIAEAYAYSKEGKLSAILALILNAILVAGPPAIMRARAVDQLPTCIPSYPDDPETRRVLNTRSGNRRCFYRARKRDRPVGNLFYFSCIYAS